MQLSVELRIQGRRANVDSIPAGTVVELRGRAITALSIDMLARVPAAVRVRIQEAFVRGRRIGVRLHKRVSNRTEMP